MSAVPHPEAPALGDLPRVEPGEAFRFACHPGVPCFNACCRDLDLLLNPYDVLRLRRNLNVTSQELFSRFVDALELPDTGFPVAALRMADSPGRPCPFVRPSGCTVYEDRPAACRTYPLGRGTGLDEGGDVIERWCLVREEHCRGFEERPEWTSATWVADQGVAEYAAVDDRYLVMVARVSRLGRRLSEQQRRASGLALFQLDRFAELLRDGDLLERLSVPCNDRDAIVADERLTLNFALNWLERELFR